MSLDSVRSWATEEVIDTWKALFFGDPTYHGQHFLQLLDTKGNLLKPSYLGGGSSLSVVGSSSGLGTAGWTGSTGDLGIGDGDLLGYG